jgi:hypothetical protein
MLRRLLTRVKRRQRRTRETRRCRRNYRPRWWLWMPKCGSLLLGHIGFGSKAMWMVEKRQRIRD